MGMVLRRTPSLLQLAVAALAAAASCCLLLPPAAVSALSQPSSTTRRAFVERVATAAGAAAIFGVVQQPSPAQAAASTSSSPLPQTGARAPAFELPNSRKDGTTSLSNLTGKGKWTVLYFYPGAFTSGCTLEARNFQRDIASYRDLGAQIVGVSVDPVEKNAQFCSAESLDFFMLSDTGGAVSKLYGSALSVPGFGSFSNRQTYLIDPDGYLRYVFTDVESRIPRHSREVLEKLSELTGKPLPEPATAAAAA